jgi:hypothetical protein
MQDSMNKAILECFMDSREVTLLGTLDAASAKVTWVWGNLIKTIIAAMK